jgi:putative PEP-CTERM system TPR-repeat lipoprotein
MRSKNRTMEIRNNLARMLLISGLVFLVSCGRDMSSDEYLGRALEYIDSGDSKAAIIELKNALVQEPGNPEARFQLGLVYLKTGNFLLANREFNRAVKEGMGTHEVYLNLTRSALRLQLLKEAEEYLTHRQPSWPPLAQAKAEALQVQLYLADKRIDASESILLPLLVRLPNNPDVLYAAALFESSKKQFNKARKTLEKLLAIDAGYAQAIELSADISFAEGEYSNAEAGYTAARKREPGNRELNLKLAQVYLADKQTKQAIHELDQLLKSTPNSWYVNYLRSLASLEQKDYQQGLEFSERSSQQEPKHLPSLFVAAVSAVGLARYETARTHLDKILAVLPQHTQSLKLKSYVELMSGGLSEGLTALSEVEPDSYVESDVALLLLAGEYALSTGDSRLAHDYLNKAAGLAKSDKRVMLSRAKMAFRSGDYEAGVDSVFSEEQLAAEPRLALYVRGAKLLAKSNITEVKKIALTLKTDYPNSPEGSILDGMSYAVIKDYDNAIVSFNKALELDSSNITAKSNLAVIARKEGKLELARDLWTDVLKFKEDKLKALYQLYEIEWALGNKDAAIAWLERAHHAHPTQDFIAKVLARKHIQKGEIEQALAVIDESLVAGPSNSGLLLFAGDLLQATGKRQAAIDRFSRAIIVSPQNIAAYYRLAVLYEELGQLDRMEEAANKVLELDTSHVGARLIACRQALREGDVEKAKKHLDVLRSHNAESFLIKELQAQIALTSGNMEEARVLFADLIEKRKNSILVNQYAISLWNTQRREEAIKVLEGWLEERPSDTRALQRLASYFIAQGNFGKAEASLLALLKTTSSAANHNNLAWVLLQQGKFDKALAHAREAQVLAPGNPGFKDTLAMIYFGKKQYEKAEGYIDDALVIQPKNAEFKYHLAQIKNARGASQEARLILEALLQRDNLNSSLKKDISTLLSGL